jgi:hypothetical protein
VSSRRSRRILTDVGLLAATVIVVVLAIFAVGLLAVVYWR